MIAGLLTGFAIFILALNIPNLRITGDAIGFMKTAEGISFIIAGVIIVLGIFAMTRKRIDNKVIENKQKVIT